MLLTTQMPLGYTDTFPQTNQPRSHATANCKSQSFFPPRATAQNVVSGRYERNPFPVAS